MTNTDVMEQTFTSALGEHLGALQARDIERFAATLHDDVVVVDGAGRRTAGKAAVVASHADWFASPDRWTFTYETLLVRETPASGFALLEVAYRQRADAAPNRFLLSLLFERLAGGSWRFVYDQNTPLA